MTDNQNDTAIDLGDAVAETKGSAMFGVLDPLGGYRQAAGLVDAD